MAETELTTLTARPRAWQRAQRWPGVLLLAVGLWSLRFGFEPLALAFVAVGLWGTAEFWRGARVTGATLLATGRISRRRMRLADVRQVGITAARTVWVQPHRGRTLVLAMAEARVDQPGAAREIADALREQAAAAGADLEPEPEELLRPPRPTTSFFGW